MLVANIKIQKPLKHQRRLGLGGKILFCVKKSILVTSSVLIISLCEVKQVKYLGLYRYIITKLNAQYVKIYYIYLSKVCIVL